MSRNSVIDLKKPEPIVEDPLTDILKKGARQLLATALGAEISFLLNQYKEITDDKRYDFGDIKI